MSDSEYQKKLLEFFQNPEMTEQMVSALKGQQFREHLEKTIQETLDSPMFKAKMTDTIIKAAEEMKPSGDSQGGGGGDQGGEQGSGGAEESGSGQEQGGS